MRRKGELPELLSPAGDMQCLYAAVLGGADAIYVGGRSFGARAYAKNFDIEELGEAVSYCHLHGVKLYVTVNTLVYDREMQELSDFVSELWRIGVDAVITADLGVIREIKRRVPELPIHASTQMSVHNLDGAQMAAKLGCERVVVARELSRENIKIITENAPIETEVFLHGALCVCHSGQCLMSSLVGGRSGNRGECAQPCRLPYNNKYILSLSDLSLANHINELIELGVASLKIEGRMKSPEYVYTVTSIYRRLLDERRSANKKENAELREVFSRGAFTDGYFVGKKFDSMTGIRSEKDKKTTKAIAPMRFEAQKVPVKATVVMQKGKPSSLTLTRGERSVTVSGQIPEAAISAPITVDSLKQRLSKMGATMLSLQPSDISVTLDEGINLPVSAVNMLRRDAAAAFCDFSREDVSTPFSPEKLTRDTAKPLITAQFLKAATYYTLKKRCSPALKSLDIVFLPIKCAEAFWNGPDAEWTEEFDGEREGVYLPPVICDTELSAVEESLKCAVQKGARYALVGNIGHISIAKRCGLIPIGDFRLNITNSYSRSEYRELGINDTVLSPELTLPMARDIGGGEIVWGRIPLMITERCFVKENFGCERCNNATLEDRTGAKFPLLKEFGHRTLILNSRPTYMGDRKGELDMAKIKHRHFIFSVESPKEIESVMASYINGAAYSGEVRRIGKR